MEKRITEASSNYNNLHKMSVGKLLTNINREDKTVPFAIERALPEIEALIDGVVEKLKNGGRLFYLGAGTSGRLGIVDASECPPTYGVDYGLVVGIIAGGDTAIRMAVEFAEDSETQGWKDLKEHNVSDKDFVIGISASGSAPYVIGALSACQKNGVSTGCISCNPNSPMAKASNFSIAVVVGPEFVTGSTRMKAGTAQKLVLNMITTTTMVKLGHVVGNKMVDMQLSNNKLVDRGVRMIMDVTKAEKSVAEELLSEHGSVRKAVNAFNHISGSK